jgi:hypothetical protein
MLKHGGLSFAINDTCTRAFSAGLSLSFAITDSCEESARDPYGGAIGKREMHTYKEEMQARK